MTIITSSSSIIQPPNGIILVSECYVTMIDEKQVLVLQRQDSVIQWINIYPVDRAISFLSTYPLYSDLSLC